MEPGSSGATQRRPLKSRSSGWAVWLARRLTELGIAPNSVSFFSVVAAAGSGACFFAAGREGAWVGLLWIGGALLVQVRLLCNLLDGMVAIEGNRRSATGELWNEVPDRFADVLILVGAGVGSGVPWLGVAAAMVALMTAYIRALGASLTGKQDFGGPMAKPHRMACITVGAVATLLPGGELWMRAALGLVAFGGVLTAIFRLKRIAAALGGLEEK